jgi:hypothetical protein
MNAGKPPPDQDADRLGPVAARALRLGGARRYPMSRDKAASMLPLLRGGDEIVWEPRAREDLRCGDLLFYGFVPRGAAGLAPRRDAGGSGAPPALSERVASEILVVHRLVRMRRDGLLRTKGDGRPALDLEPVAFAQVVGVVVALEREGYRISLRGRGAARYAQLARLVSLAGAGTYRVAGLGDGALRRLLLRRQAPFFFRPVAARLQAAVQKLLHVLAFRLFHRIEALPVESEAPPPRAR